MREYDIDYYAKAIFFQNELYTLKDLGEKIKFNLSNGNYKIGDLYMALERLQTALESTKEIQLILPNNLYNKCLTEANSKKLSVEQFLVKFLENAFEAKEIKNSENRELLEKNLKNNQIKTDEYSSVEKTKIEIPIVPNISIDKVESTKSKTYFSSAEQLIMEENTNIERPTGKIKKSEIESSNLTITNSLNDVVVEEVIIHQKPILNNVEQAQKTPTVIEEVIIEQKKSDIEILEEIVVPKQKKEPLNIEDILLKKNDEIQKNKSEQSEPESEDVVDDWFK
jgi:tetratricopeptide (TPR) repeat protein